MMMNNIEQYDDLIEKFLRGEMTIDEEKKFKEEIENNAELKSRAMAISSLVRGLKRKFAEEEQAVIEEVRIDKKKSWFSFRRIAVPLSIAAVVIIMFGIFNGNSRQDELNDLVTPYYNIYGMDNIARGEEDSAVVTELANIFKSIENSDDCAEMILKLLPIYKSLDKDITYRPYANEVSWYLAIAYIKNDQIPESVKVLNKLVEDNPETEIANKAGELLNKLKNQ